MSTITDTIFEIITDNEELHAELTSIMDARSPSRGANPTQPCYETPFSNIMVPESASPTGIAL